MMNIFIVYNDFFLDITFVTTVIIAAKNEVLIARPVTRYSYKSNDSNLTCEFNFQLVGWAFFKTVQSMKAKLTHSAEKEVT